MRNRVVHDYSGVDVSVVWQTSTGDLLSLRSGLQGVLERLVEP